MREQAGRYLPLPWMRYPVRFQDEAARQAIESACNGLYVPTPCPPCRKCGTKEIYCWPADAPQKALCPQCCDKSEDGHEFRYERGEGYRCQHCGDEPSHDWYADRASDW